MTPLAKRFTRKEIKASLRTYLVLLPIMVLFVSFRFIPMLDAFRLGFQKWDLVQPQWVGFDNYRQFVADSVYWKVMLNTFVYTVGTVPGGILIALFLSALIFPLNRVSQSIFKAAFYLPAVASAVVVAMVWRWIFDPTYGLLNQVLAYFDIGPFLWLRDMKMAMPSLVFMALAGGHGAAVVLLTAAMGSIPTSYYEAARMDGSTWWQELWRISLPLLKPTLLYLLVMNTIASFQVFTAIYLMTNGGPNNATATVVFRIYKTAFDYFKFGLASAQAVVLFAIIMVIAIVQFKSLSTDVEY